MGAITSNRVLAEAVLPVDGTGLLLKRAVLVMAGVAALAAAAKVSVPVWPSPVPITLTTFAVLTIGAAYGPRLGLTTIMIYLLIGALGANVFAGSSAEKAGLTYMMGGTGGYLVGYALATAALGAFARAGWDRSMGRMGVALLVGNALIYVPGLLWLHQFASGWEQTLAWGITPFLIGDGLKLALAALLLPVAWRLVGSARG